MAQDLWVEICRHQRPDDSLYFQCSDCTWNQSKWALGRGPQLPEDRPKLCGPCVDGAVLPHQKKPWLTGSERFCSMFSIFFNNPVSESNVARMYCIGKGAQVLPSISSSLPWSQLPSSLWYPSLLHCCTQPRKQALLEQLLQSTLASSGHFSAQQGLWD